jgi:hypothetical protein
MADGDKLARYIAEKVYTYLETPRRERRRQKRTKRKYQERWMYRWFGMLPFAMQHWMGRIRKKE